jgi:glucose dehydrogenase
MSLPPCQFGANASIASANATTRRASSDVQVRSGALSTPGATTESMTALARGEWPACAGTYATARHSPLAQINAANAGDLSRLALREIP